MVAFRPGSLRLRFAWRAGLMTLVLAAAVGLGLGLFWQGRVKDAVHEGVAGHLRALETELDLGAVPLTDGSDSFVLPSPESFVQVVTPTGQVVASSSELTTALPLLPIADILRTEGGVETTIPDPTRPGKDAFVMARQISVRGTDYLGIVGASLGPVETGRRFTYLAVGVGAPVLALLVASIVWISIRLALAPVYAMAEEADRMARGSGSWRLGVQPDTVELKRLAESLDDLLLQIRDAFERERRFLDDASHELRTPIAVARGELDLAHSATAGDEELSKALASAIEELDRLDRLAADLLVLARARGARPGTSTTCDLGGIARRAAGAVMRGAGVGAPVDLRVSGEASAIGDERALDRALTNVIANAVDFCRERIDITLAMSDGEAVVTVVDDGPGFPPEFLETAFERFRRDRRRAGDGTGLGLAIASAIVRAHSGSVEAVNIPEGGARVTIRLPGSEEHHQAVPLGNPS